MHALWLGHYELDLDQTPETVARFLQETSPELTVDVNELRREFEDGREEFATLRIELREDSLTLSQDGERDTFAIESWRDQNGLPLIDTRSEDGEAFSFELRSVGTRSVVFFSPMHSLGQYAWRKIDATETEDEK